MSAFKQFDVTITFSVSVPNDASAMDWCRQVNQRVIGAAAEFTANANAATTPPITTVLERNEVKEV